MGRGAAPWSRAIRREYVGIYGLSLEEHRMGTVDFNVFDSDNHYYEAT
ncbi:MAG: hypothetical protein QOI55_2789, partial [Actinomycetota bacterium]|nr:hypothetical protein [Actinomycetota bacterium]